jgi:hypothetical protein
VRGWRVRARPRREGEVRRVGEGGWGGGEGR